MISSSPKYFLIIFGCYHLIAGSFAIAPFEWLKMFGKKLYRLDFPAVVDVRYFLCIKFLGLMALMVGGLSFMVALGTDHSTQAVSLVFYGILFLGRAGFRLFYQEKFYEAYQLDFQRNLKNIIFNTVLALFTFYLAWVSHAAPGV